MEGIFVVGGIEGGVRRRGAQRKAIGSEFWWKDKGAQNQREVYFEERGKSGEK